MQILRNGRFWVGRAVADILWSQRMPGKETAATGRVLHLTEWYAAARSHLILCSVLTCYDTPTCHCEERSDEAISDFVLPQALTCHCEAVRPWQSPKLWEIASPRSQ